MELLQRENPRTVRLIEYLLLLIDKQAGKAEFHAYESVLHNTTPFEVNDALDHVLSRSDDVESLALPVAQFIRAVSKSLEAYQSPTYPDDHLLHSLQAENRVLEEFSSRMQRLALEIQHGEKRRAQEKATGTEVSPNSDQIEQRNSILPLKDLVAFPRSPQLIGRLVQNCHPPKSVATVEKILTSFKEGSEDSAEFYLTIGKKFVHIEYFAVRNMEGSYLGTLEVTQDATHLRELSGEKRLL